MGLGVSPVCVFVCVCRQKGWRWIFVPLCVCCVHICEPTWPIQLMSVLHGIHFLEPPGNLLGWSLVNGRISSTWFVWTCSAFCPQGFMPQKQPNLLPLCPLHFQLVRVVAATFALHSTSSRIQGPTVAYGPPPDPWNCVAVTTALGSTGRI